MAKSWQLAFLSRIVGRGQKKDVYRVEVLDPALGRKVVKGDFPKISEAEEYADRIAETVGRIGV